MAAEAPGTTTYGRLTMVCDWKGSTPFQVGQYSEDEESTAVQKTLEDLGFDTRKVWLDFSNCIGKELGSTTAPQPDALESAQSAIEMMKADAVEERKSDFTCHWSGGNLRDVREGADKCRSE